MKNNSGKSNTQGTDFLRSLRIVPNEVSSYDAAYEDVSYVCGLPFYDVCVFYRLAYQPPFVVNVVEGFLGHAAQPLIVDQFRRIFSATFSLPARSDCSD